MKIKRYTFDELNQKLVEDPNGKYVRIEDAAKLAHEYRNQGIMAGSFLADENAEELRKLRDLMRWRKVGEEMPTDRGYYLTIELGKHCFLDFWPGEWKRITHWRPIGPMPEGGE